MSERRFWGLLGAVVALGVAWRVWLFVRSGWRIEYDEAMLGLMGLQILRGEAFPLTLAAQPTLGALEAYIVAGVFALFGVGAVSLRVVSLLYVAGTIGGVGVLARVGYGQRAGVLAALVAALAPPYLIAIGTKVWAGTMTTLMLGTWLMVAVLWALQPNAPRRAARWALVGGVGGVMLWTAFLSAYYLLPCALMMGVWLARALISQRATPTAALRWVGAALVGALIGSLPFWVFNLQNDWLILRMTLGSEPSNAAQLRAIGLHLLTDLLPRLMSGSPEWGGIGATLRYGAAALALAGVAALVMRAAQGSPRQRARVLIAAVALAVPLIYIPSGFARNALNPYGIDATGRYVLMWHSVLPIGIAVLGLSLARRWRWMGAGVVAGCIALNVWGATWGDAQRLFDSPYYDRLPSDLAPVIDALSQEGVRYVWTDNGIGLPIMFYTQTDILTADYWDAVIAGGLVRFPQYYAQVQAASDANEPVAYLLPVLPTQTEPPIVRALAAAGVSYRTRRIGGLVLYLPDVPTPPQALAGGLGYQY